MMDITVIWFPLLKGFVTALLAYGVYYFYKTDRKRVAGYYGLLLIIFWVATPLKYDGTNSVQRSIDTQRMQTSRYDDVQREAVRIHTVKPTFDERMEAEAKRSREANRVVKEEIVR